MNNFDWIEYKTFAQMLENGSSSRECAIRNMISRLFYYSFHCLLVYAESHLSFNGRGPGCHGKLTKHFRNNRKFEEARWFTSLRLLRESCDYDDALPSPEDDLKQALGLVENIRTRYGKYSISTKAR